MQLAGYNQFSWFVYIVGVVFSQIGGDWLVDDCTMVDKDSDFCFGIGGIDWLATRPWRTHVVFSNFRIWYFHILIRIELGNCKHVANTQSKKGGGVSFDDGVHYLFVFLKVVSKCMSFPKLNLLKLKSTMEKNKNLLPHHWGLTELSFIIVEAKEYWR